MSGAELRSITGRLGKVGQARSWAGSPQSSLVASQALGGAGLPALHLSARKLVASAAEVPPSKSARNRRMISGRATAQTMFSRSLRPCRRFHCRQHLVQISTREVAPVYNDPCNLL